MGMDYLPGERASDVAAWFERIGDTTSKKALRAMRRVALNVKDKAVLYAPVLRGDLEHAIQEREEVGANRRLQAIVEVTDNGLTRNNVLDYAALAEEGVTAAGGEAKRGAGTIAKGPQAGPHFLERAFDEYADDIPEEIIDEILGDLL